MFYLHYYGCSIFKKPHNAQCSSAALNQESAHDILDAGGSLVRAGHSMVHYTATGYRLTSSSKLARKS